MTDSQFHQLIATILFTGALTRNTWGTRNGILLAAAIVEFLLSLF